VAHTAASQTDAFDLVLEDVLPTQLDFVSLDCDDGAQDPDVCTYTPGTRTMRAEWNSPNDFVLGGGTGIIRITVQGNAIAFRNPVTNLGVLMDKLPGDYSRLHGQQRPFNGAPFRPPSVSTSTATMIRSHSTRCAIRRTTASVPVTGFAPGRTTDIAGVPDNSFALATDLQLQLPTQNATIPIVGVPLRNGHWEVSSVWNQVGWLQSTAYPTYNGNSVLTSHVVTADGKAGPFARLNRLAKDDQVYVVSNGFRYRYVVRDVRYVSANDISVLGHKVRPWLTLITCDQYDELTGKYLRRLVVEAELLLVERVN
jgi:LPXTG-site transpeptidase (sortase) family protein